MLFLAPAARAAPRKIASKADSLAGCGQIQFVSLSTTTFTPRGTPENVSMTFAQPWWPTQTVGKILWNYCKSGGKTPTINDALLDLKKKAWEAGGRHLVIEKNDLSPENPKVLKIEARIVY